MNTPLPTIEPQVPAVCRLLRTKNYFATYADTGDAPWESGESTTAVFWCLATMQTAGPDDRLAHPTVCCAGRGRQCFQPREG